MVLYSQTQMWTLQRSYSDVSALKYLNYLIFNFLIYVLYVTCFFSMLPLFVRALETEYFIKNNKSVVYITYTTDISIYNTIRVCVDVLRLFLVYQFCVFYIL